MNLESSLAITQIRKALSTELDFEARLLSPTKFLHSPPPNKRPSRSQKWKILWGC